MVIDEQDFMGGVDTIVQNAFFFGILLLLLLVVVSAIVSRKLTKPIVELSSEANLIASGNFGKEIEVKSNSKEIYSLIESFNTMSSSLKESFDTLQDINKNLESIVSERTKELQDAKDILQETHKNIQDSIRYGSLIQHTILPDNELFSDFYQDFFIIWDPKDTVGGDIYLFEKLGNENESLLMVIDCTGHGVPGAFVTMLVKAIERQIIANIKYGNEEISPASILSYFNKTIKHLLKQETEESISNAGFDGGILYYNKKEKTIKYAGANTPLFIIENKELRIIKGDRHSIGYKKSDANFVFQEYVIDANDGMSLYLTTDGYIDQNGGEKGFPFGKKRFESLILENHTLSFQEQREILIDNFSAYKQNEDRNDDVTVVGIKI
jgi:serine phosphatase RsbU (regulator of sigma subunit)